LFISIVSINLYLKDEGMFNIVFILKVSVLVKTLTTQTDIEQRHTIKYHGHIGD